MLFHSVTDWTEAYAVAPHVPDGSGFPGRWAEKAAKFREDMTATGQARLDIPYGRHPRQALDLFLPKGTPKGLVVFMHGGFWKAFDKSSWSHLAAGALGHGYSVAMPSYRLCPEVRITAIVEDAATAISHSVELIQGPIYLAGHSAGGHLVARMLAQPSPLDPGTLARTRRCLSISGLHDLRPLMQAEMNSVLRLDEAEVIAQSPALLRPCQGIEFIAWVGSAERAEFLRQNALLPAIWGGLGAMVAPHVAPDRHHFDVVDGLEDMRSTMLTALLGPATHEILHTK
ncbi:MAG TPA: alpha/beta hydrolase [Tabrizicola sp.]|nr:alpha/beta hydrolase [Tabrizicola sp.]